MSDPVPSRDVSSLRKLWSGVGGRSWATSLSKYTNPHFSYYGSGKRLILRFLPACFRFLHTPITKILAPHTSSEHDLGTPR